MIVCCLPACSSDSANQEVLLQLQFGTAAYYGAQDSHDKTWNNFASRSLTMRGLESERVERFLSRLLFRVLRPVLGMPAIH